MNLSEVNCIHFKNSASTRDCIMGLSEVNYFILQYRYEFKRFCVYNIFDNKFTKNLHKSKICT